MIMKRLGKYSGRIYEENEVHTMKECGVCITDEEAKDAEKDLCIQRAFCIMRNRKYGLFYFGLLVGIYGSLFPESNLYNIRYRCDTMNGRKIDFRCFFQNLGDCVSGYTATLCDVPLTES